MRYKIVASKKQACLALANKLLLMQKLPVESIFKTNQQYEACYTRSSECILLHLIFICNMYAQH